MMTPANQNQALDYSWLIVISGGIILGLAMGIRHAQGIFMLPITMGRGWSREAFGFAIAMQNLVWGLAQPFTGMLADRFGPRFVMAFGLLCYGLGLILMSVAETPLVFTLAAGVCTGVALACTAFAVVYGAVSRAIQPALRSQALGIAGAIGGLGQFLLVPLAQGLVVHIGWAETLSALGIFCILALPFCLGMKSKVGTSDLTQQPLSSAISEAFRHRGFWLLTLGFFACGFQLAFIASHLPAYLLDKGLSGNDTVVGLATIALANVFGTYFCGWLGGFKRRKYLLSIIYLMRTASMILFIAVPLTPWGLYAFCAVMGFIWLGTVPLTNGLISQIFGIQHITTLFGFVFFGHQLGSFFGVWLGGYVFDATHSYQLIWAISIVLGLIAAILHYPINDRALSRSGMIAT